jgi:hypothetical protein
VHSLAFFEEEHLLSKGTCSAAQGARAAKVALLLLRFFLVTFCAFS